MNKTDIDDVLSVLRRQGFSKEFCDEIRKNADAGALDYAVSLIQGVEDSCVGGTKSQSVSQEGRRLFYQSHCQRSRY